MATTSRDPDVARQTSPPASPAPIGTSRWQKVIGAMGLVVVFWVGNNLFDTITSGGTGPGGGPGGHAPAGGTPTSQPNGDDDPATSGGDDGGHDPARFGHG